MLNSLLKPGSHLTNNSTTKPLTQVIRNPSHLRYCLPNWGNGAEGCWSNFHCGRHTFCFKNLLMSNHCTADGQLYMMDAGRNTCSIIPILNVRGMNMHETFWSQRLSNIGSIISKCIVEKTPRFNGRDWGWLLLVSCYFGDYNPSRTQFAQKLRNLIPQISMPTIWPNLHLTPQEFANAINNPLAVTPDTHWSSESTGNAQWF